VIKYATKVETKKPENPPEPCNEKKTQEFLLF
jgi:hypothetical protein